MIQKHTLKTLLVIAGSASSGFYLGGRYVGELAIHEYIGPKPRWVATAQGTLWAVLGIAMMCVFAWMLLDYRSRPA